MARTTDELTRIDREIGELTGVFMGRGRIGDRPYDELLAEAQSIAARNKKRAGVKALIRKYGHQGAENIVRKYSGRTIRH